MRLLARVVGLCVAFAGCEATAPAPRPRGRVTRGVRLSERVFHEALERVTPMALRCLSAGDRITVDGTFHGRDGRFEIDRVGSETNATDNAARQCVAVVLENARVPPFGNRRRRMQWTVAGPDVSPAVQALLNDRDGGAGPVAPVVGSIDERVVTGLIEGEHQEFQACYETELRAVPGIHGEVEFRLVITPEGAVSEADFTAPPGMEPVCHCILGRLRQLTYPRARNGSVEMRYPFRFEPGVEVRGTGTAM